MISLILLCIAGIFNAMMDKVTHHYDVSVFKNLDRDYFDPSVSWRRKYFITIVDGREVLTHKPFPFLDAFCDFWHTCKTVMMTTIVFAIVFYKPMFNWYVDFSIIGIISVSTFSLFYSKILKTK